MTDATESGQERESPLDEFTPVEVHVYPGSGEYQQERFRVFVYGDEDDDPHAAGSARGDDFHACLRAAASDVSPENWTDPNSELVVKRDSE